jgi:hypothetical protein
VLPVLSILTLTLGHPERRIEAGLRAGEMPVA